LAVALAACPLASCSTTTKAAITTTTVAPVSTTSTVAATTTSTSPSLLLQGKTIVIDPGHNGGNFLHPSVINQLVFVGNGTKACDTTGTETDSGYTEAAFNFDVALRLQALLVAAGAHVILTRTNNTGVGPCVTQRAAIGNDAHADAAISIHADGGPPGGYGFQVLEPAPIAGYNTAIVAPSDRLGLDVRRDYQSATGEAFSTYVGTDALDVRSDLGGLNLSTVPKVFIECGNMRNSTDAAKLESPAFRQEIAVGLAQAFADFLAGS
jgi:N-acetylmuramoyl-L-alanine amidase